jgi:hypothetical protein
MNFKELQDEVIASRFREAQRPRVKRWVNWRYQWVNSVANWPWMEPIVETVAFTDPLTLDSDVVRVLHVHDVDNDVELRYVNLTDWRRLYADSDTGTQPSTYTLDASTGGATRLLLGPPSSVTGSLQVIFHARPPALEDDLDEPQWPENWHFLITLGAISTGLKIENDPTWEALETEFLAALQMMKDEILPPLQPEPRQFGRELFDAWY